MKHTKFLVFALLSLVMASCIENDYISDLIEERIAINNPVSEVELNSSYQFEATFFDNIGQPADVPLTWSSSNVDVAIISSTGLLTAIAEGSTLITASTTLENDKVVAEEFSITVTSNPINTEPISKSGVIITTSSYLLEGNFTISEIADSNNLNLEIAENYQASTALPGLYLYLTNNPNSINGALELGPVQVFNGAHAYEIEDVGINDYAFLLYWCKPFTVKVGEGEIND